MTSDCSVRRGHSWRAVLELLEMMQHLAAVERLDVARLRRRESPHGPAQVNEMRLDGMRERMHSDLFGQPIAFARVTGAARRHDVGPLIRLAARQRNQVVARERLPGLELRD